MNKQTAIILILIIVSLQVSRAQFPGVSAQRVSVALKHGAHHLGKRMDPQMEI
ncbi:hypothetical protein SAMN05216436_11113 [bacterium A37T11]|nr:hypothetical protein SAMN05216436_11113 [bacterium A37T11]